MSKVSIIVPVYNAEQYLIRCLNSIINQTYKNIEIICINDGSTDNSSKILKEYAQKDSRINIINRENGGLSVARNNGLDVATGEYCYFIDSDDWIELHTIEQLVNIITTYNVCAVEHNLINIPKDDSCVAKAQEFQNYIDARSKTNGMYAVPVDINKKILVVPFNKLYRMDIINRFHCRFPEGLVNEDELFVWEYFIHCNNYYYIGEKLYNYFRHMDSITGKIDHSPKTLDIFEILERIYKIVEKYKNIEDYKEYLICNYIERVEYQFFRIPKKYQSEALRRVKNFYETVIRDKRILKIYRKQKYRYLSRFLRIAKCIFQNIFSVRNERKNGVKRKIITLLGIKLKLTARPCC